jgi:hypothetical protein
MESISCLPESFARGRSQSVSVRTHPYVIESVHGEDIHIR